MFAAPTPAKEVKNDETHVHSNDPSSSIADGRWIFPKQSATDKGYRNGSSRGSGAVLARVCGGELWSQPERNAHPPNGTCSCRSCSQSHRRLDRNFVVHRSQKHRRRLRQ